MKRALIHRPTNRLCQVEQRDFPVHADLEWLDCANDVRPETHDFDGASFVLKPAQPAPVGKTPDEIDAMIDSDVTTLAGARSFLKKLVRQFR